MTYLFQTKQDLISGVFNMIVGINESRILTKHISCECKCKFDGRKFNSNQKWNNDKYRYACKNPNKEKTFEKDYIWTPITYSCKKVNI